MENQDLIHELKALEFEAQNLKLGARILELEARVMELEAEAARQNREKMMSQIEIVGARVSANMDDFRARVAERLGKPPNEAIADLKGS
jgi:acetate kinase